MNISDVASIGYFLEDVLKGGIIHANFNNFLNNHYDS